MSWNEIIILVATGLLAGIVGGLLGVGGAIIIIPSLVFLLGMSQHYAQGTSLAVLLFPIGIMAVVNYHKEGFINYKYALVLILTFVVGSYLGSLVAVNISGSALKKIFAVLLFVVAIKMFFDK
jgi:hypothetical protein